LGISGRLTLSGAGDTRGLLEKKCFPIIYEMAWRAAGQRMTLADEMRLVEIAGLMDNLGPRLSRSVAVRDERCIKPDSARVELGGQTDLARETTLKLTRTETRSVDQRIDPGAATRC
jgi:hypothetical protein